MASAAIIGKGTILSVEDSGSSGGGFIPFVELQNLTLPNVTGGEVEVSHYESGVFRDFISNGFLDAGSITVEGNYIADKQDMIESLANIMTTYRIDLPNGRGYEFDGYIKEYSNDVPFDNKIDSKFTIRVSGAPRPF